MKQPYKKGFFILLSLIIIGLVSLAYLATRPIETHQAHPKDNIIRDESVEFYISLTPEELESLVNTQIRKQGLDLNLTLGPKVELTMPVEAYGQTFDLYLQGQAEVEGGNIAIDLDHIQLGQLKLASQMTLALAKLAIPETVPLAISGSKLIIQLDQISSNDNLLIQASKFNADTNSYEFKITMSKAKLLEGLSHQ